MMAASAKKPATKTSKEWATNQLTSALKDLRIVAPLKMDFSAFLGASFLNTGRGDFAFLTKEAFKAYPKAETAMLVLISKAIYSNREERKPKRLPRGKDFKKPKLSIMLKNCVG